MPPRKLKFPPKPLMTAKGIFMEEKRPGVKKRNFQENPNFKVEEVAVRWVEEELEKNWAYITDTEKKS